MERPKQLDTIDLTALKEICSDYITEVELGDNIDSDTDHYIFETAMEAIYGKDIFLYLKVINKN